jgi:hypothetical protein
MNGMETVVHVVDQLISIGNESKMYKGNALQFLELRSLNEGNPGPNEPTNIIISVKDLVIFFGHSKDKGLAPEVIATANLEFDFSAVIVSEKLEHMNLDIVSLALQSSGDYILFSVVSEGPLSPMFIRFTKHHAGRDELLVSVPFFEMWLYLVDWTMIIDHVNSYVNKEVNSLEMEHPTALPHSSERVSPPSLAPEFDSSDDANLVVTFETIAGVFHIPIWENEENHRSNIGGIPGSFPIQVVSHHVTDDIRYCEPKICKFVTLTFESKNFVVMSSGRSLKFKCDFERIKVMLEMIQKNKGTSTPFVHISKVKACGYIHQSEGNLEHLFVDLQAEYMDVSFSHQIFSFWHNIEFKFPSASSAPSYCSMTFKVGLRKGSLLLNDGRVSCVMLLPFYFSRNEMPLI